jgi:hypothetical protein
VTSTQEPLGQCRGVAQPPVVVGLLSHFTVIVMSIPLPLWVGIEQ